jgi:16S rRNA processing protein RimM
MGEIYSSKPGRAEQLREVKLEVDGRGRVVQIERVWHHQGRPVFKFAGIYSIAEAELWQRPDMLVPEAERLEPAEGEYRHADLTGCSMIAAGSGKPVGVVRGVEEFGGPPLLRVEAANGREILVPFARTICREIDVAAKIIRVELPEGLMELP